MKVLYDTVLKGTFVRRPNRFVVHIELEGQEVAAVLDWKAVSLRWDESFSMPEVVGECAYEPAVLDREAHDAGDYIMVLHAV